MNLGEVIEALRGTGPDSMMKEARDPGVWKKTAGSCLLQGMISDIRKTAERLAGTDIPSLPYRYYRTFDINGSRQEYEVYYFGRRKRLNTFALLSLLEPEGGYEEELSDIIWAVCDEYSWCLPAHMTGQSMRIGQDASFLNEKGMYAGKATDQKYMIDLFGAETGFALAEITALLYDRLDPFLCYRARSLIFERILLPYLDVDTDRRDWENGTANWTAVCAGSVGAAALYLIEEPMLLGRIVYRVMNSMESFIEGYGEDGACPEGLSYWSYGFGFFVYFADLLKARTNGKIDLLRGPSAEKINKIMTFQQKCFLYGRKAVSFSDAPRENWYGPGLTHYLHRINPEVVIPPTECMAAFGDDGCHRWASDLRNLVWTDPDFTDSEEEKDVYYKLEQVQWVILKSGGFCFACKGGHNKEPHNHNDVGSFLLHDRGDAFLADVGVGMHSKQYFGPERYSFFAASSAGHSLPIIDGQYQKEGGEHGASQFRTGRNGDVDEVSYEIGGAYEIAGLRILRAFQIDRKKRRMIVTDTFSFERKPQSLVERMVTMIEPDVAKEAEGIVRLRGACAEAVIRYDAGRWKLRVSAQDYKPSRDEINRVYCMDFSMTEPDGEAVFLMDVAVI